MEPAHTCDCWKKYTKRKKNPWGLHLHIWEENSFDQELVEDAQTSDVSLLCKLFGISFESKGSFVI